jgi:hypothetical protein
MNYVLKELFLFKFNIIMKVNSLPTKEYKIISPFINTRFINNPYIHTILFKCRQDNILAIFVDIDILIYSINNDGEFSYRSSKNAEFISESEEILFLKNQKSTTDSQNTNFLIGTTKGNIFLLKFIEFDYFFEVIQNFNIRQNFIHEYEILEYVDQRYILATIDKHLYLIEIYSKTHIAKNFLLTMEYRDERISNAIKVDSSIFINTNKAIYSINLDDCERRIVFEKQILNSFDIQILGNYLYFIKEESKVSRYSLSDNNDKSTATISSKNMLNKVNFFTFIQIDNQSIILANERETEIYFLNDKFKLVHRESLIFDSCYNVYLDGTLYVLNLNIVQYTLKIKKFVLSSNEITEQEENKESFDTKENELQNLILLEHNFLNFKHSIAFISRKIKELKNKIKNLIYCSLIWRINSKIELNYEKFESEKQKLIKYLQKLYNLYYELPDNKSTSKLNENCLSIFHLFKKTILFHFVRVYECNFRSYSLHKTFDILYMGYYINMYRDKLNYLLQLSYSTLDRHSLKELLELYN